MKRATNAEVYAQMEADITKAIECLKGSNIQKSIYRPNLTGAYLLASRIALFQQKYDDVVTYSDVVINDFGKQLTKLSETPGENKFLSFANKEILFSYGTTTIESYMKPDFGYAGDLVVSKDLLAQYSENDLRLSQFFQHTVGKQRRPVAKTIEYYVPSKWSSTSPTVYSNAFRLSEAYLNRAEAYAEKGEQDKAMDDLKTLSEHRMKSGAQPLEVDAEGIVATVRKERRRELAFEGFRWFDLRRYGCPVIEHVYTSKNTEGAGDKFKLQDKDLYTLPIPKSERDKNMQIEIFSRPENKPVSANN